MEVQQLIEEARETMGAKGVYGTPYEHNGVTVIPAAVVRGGGGGGGGSGPEGVGRGGGFGLKASPSGAWVIENGTVEWKPAIDLNRAIRGGQLVALAAILTVRSLARPKRPARRLGLPRQRRRTLGLPDVRGYLPSVPRLRRHRRRLGLRALPFR
jgi:hypothetical protein